MKFMTKTQCSKTYIDGYWTNSGLRKIKTKTKEKSQDQSHFLRRTTKLQKKEKQKHINEEQRQII